jgi:DNA-binding transcriptional LysR family regulator
VGAHPRIARTSKKIETVKALVARGEGYTIAVTPLIDARSPEGLPIEIRPIADDIPITNVVIARSSQRLSSRAVVLLQACRIAAADIFATDE